MASERKDLLNSFEATLPEAERAALEAALRAATATGAGLYLVGGPVRDLLLGRPSLDIDIAVEGDVPGLAADLELATGHRVVQHGRFGTATLRGDGFSIDFARCRRETYARPGALPEVEAAAIHEDLARRDFTINAMALRLTEPAGALLDPFQGRLDLEQRLVRVLHQHSFQDDATRMLRACRYAARLDFKVEPGAERMIGRDLAYLDTITGPRLRQELSRAFKEPTAAEAVALMQRLGLLVAVHLHLDLESSRDSGAGSRILGWEEAWRQAIVGHHHAPVEELGFCMISSCRSEVEVSTLSARLHLAGRVEAALVGLVRLAASSDKLDRPDLKPSQAVELLAPYAPSAVWALALRSGGLAGRRCLSYLESWRRVRPSLDGNDLRALGMSGVEIGVALKRLRAARLDGEVQGRKEETDLILRDFRPGASLERGQP